MCFAITTGETHSMRGMHVSCMHLDILPSTIHHWFRKMHWRMLPVHMCFANTIGETHATHFRSLFRSSGCSV